MAVLRLFSPFFLAVLALVDARLLAPRSELSSPVISAVVETPKDEKQVEKNGDTDVVGTKVTDVDVDHKNATVEVETKVKDVDHKKAVVKKVTTRKPVDVTVVINETKPTKTTTPGPKVKTDVDTKEITVGRPTTTYRQNDDAQPPEESPVHGWTLWANHRCSSDWNNEWAEHVNVPLKECIWRCAQRASCQAITVGTNIYGKDNCVLCDEAQELTFDRSWHIYSKPHVADHVPAPPPATPPAPPPAATPAPVPAPPPAAPPAPPPAASPAPPPAFPPAAAPAPRPQPDKSSAAKAVPLLFILLVVALQM